MRRTERTHDGLDAPDGLLRPGDVEQRSLLVARVHVFCACTREVAPDRPADFTGVFYAPKYPLDGLGVVPFTQIS